MKTILITGSTRGIGKAIKEKLETNGFLCICPTRDELNLDDVLSISNYIGKNELKIDGLVNCAGINILSNIENIEVSQVDDMLNTNLVGPLFLIKEICKNMKKNNYGRVVNISSIWGVRSKEYRTLYSMTKFGINGLTKSLARELGEYNILINSVAPGYVNTEMTQKNVPEEEQEKIKKTIPLGRFAEPEEIAELVMFLISEKNSYITGEVITIDGGFLA